MSASPRKRSVDCILSNEEDSENGAPLNKKAALPVDATDNSRIRVFVRIRPESEKETNSLNVIDVIDSQMLVFDPLIENQDFVYHGKRYKEIGKRANKNATFFFDRVFDQNSSNIEVYEAVTKRFITSLLDGFNCTVFAYGATGSGKTHTMLGSIEDPGVIFFTSTELFKSIDEKTDEQLEVSVSYFEVYNEVVYDLLSPVRNKPLSVRDDPQRGVVVANLSVHHPRDAHHLIEMLESGNSQRCQQATDANEQSSRSHAIFQISLKKQDFSSSQQRCIQLSKMSLIDLAGSERASVAYKANRSKSLQREGGNINKSLLALGNCINALTNHDPKKGNKYIPYRSSKLTLLLKDSLGGNCQTAMIATVSPSNLSFDDSYNTLSYAHRAKGIQLNVKRQTVAVGIQPRHYTQALESLEQKNKDLETENQMLLAEIARLQKQMKSLPDNPVSDQKGSVDILNSCKNTLDRFFEERISLRRELMECESNTRKIDLRLMLRKLESKRIKVLTGRNEEGDASKKDHLRALYSQKVHYDDVKEVLLKKIEDNEKILSDLEADVRKRTETGDLLIDAYFTDQHLKTEFKDMCYAEKHANEIANELMSRFDANEEVIVEAMSLIRHTHLLLSGMNRLSEELQEKFLAIQRKVEGKKSVVWRDNVPRRDRLSVYAQIDLRHVLLLPTYTAIPRSPLTDCVSSDLITVCNGLTPDCDEKFKTITATITKSVAAILPMKSDMKENDLNDTFTVDEPAPSVMRVAPRNRKMWRPYHVPNSRVDMNMNREANWNSNTNRNVMKSNNWREPMSDRQWNSHSQYTIQKFNGNRFTGNKKGSNSPFTQTKKFRF
ncbi:kinesin-like protein KIF18A [Leptotrombidium deliense]|uniref:Kinesin-like protein n=1 Tax=Leptotrombidium deliense TaxID=299467 RepID=A0A443SU64_9ACAR|nr:kinesin-like protein KIF18A [Leptotrombidium deliense]